MMCDVVKGKTECSNEATVVFRIINVEIHKNDKCYACKEHIGLVESALNEDDRILIIGMISIIKEKEKVNFT